MPDTTPQNRRGGRGRIGYQSGGYPPLWQLLVVRAGNYLPLLSIPFLREALICSSFTSLVIALMCLQGQLDEVSCHLPKWRHSEKEEMGGSALRCYAGRVL